MKVKNLTVILLTFFLAIGYSQNPDIKAELPDVVPPSPTVAALMKFEEIPVNNYTGIPDISIPLYSTRTLSKDISLDISLKYHSAGTGVDERASDVGLGWSLFAGGTIARTARGLPDEIYDTQGINQGKGKIGIYHTTATYANNYYNILNYALNLSSVSQNLLNTFLYNASERGIYDTEHDLWSYNFMGKSGSFFIKKNKTTGLLEVTNQDITSTLKIINHYNSSNFVPTSFVVYDDLGYKYIFDVIEETILNSITTTYGFGFNSSPVTTVSPDLRSISAFHLSKIFSPNNEILVELEYNGLANKNIEATMDVSTIDYLPMDLTFSDDYAFIENNFNQGMADLIGPSSTNTISNKRTVTKKLKQIKVKGHCKIDFIFDKGRLDSNFIVKDSSYVFKGLEIKKWNDSLFKKVSLDHVYLTTVATRMFLQAVHQENIQNTKKETYSLEYREFTGAIDGSITKDAYGYFNIRPSLEIEGGYYYRDVHHKMCLTESLQKMSLPSGGCIIFDFEANTYSYIGSDLDDSFDDNHLNWDKHSTTRTFNSSTNCNQYSCPTQNFFTIYDEQSVIFTSSFILPNSNFSEYFLNIERVQESGPNLTVGAIIYSMCQNNDCSLKLNLQPGVYVVNFFSPDFPLPTPFSLSITAHYKHKNTNNFNFNFGGGFRIKQIGYFSNSVPKNYYQDNLQSIEPDVEKIFNYSLFSDASKSSGSLVSGKPVFSYVTTKASFLDRSSSGGLCLGSSSKPFTFNKESSYNVVKSMKTSGSDVGYKNVKVYEKNNGYTEFIYSSPIDFPEDINTTYPFISHSNYDFKRGLIKTQTMYDESNRKLSETQQEYVFEELPDLTTIYGLNFSSSYVVSGGNAQGTLHNNPYSWLYSNYSDYIQGYNLLNNCNQLCHFAKLPCMERNYMLLPSQYIFIDFLKTANGWAKLSSKTTKNYFYHGTVQKEVETIENFTYNSLNKRIASHSTTNSLGETQLSNFFYHSGNSVHTQNRISEIEKIDTYVGGVLSSSKKINYSNSWTGNVSYLPQTIQSSKGDNALETKVKYNHYDAYSNPLEVQQENGMLISYIWGYYHTVPVAKLENIGYTSIPSNLITAIHNATTESAMNTALTALRNSSVLSNAMITTMTYIPLVGVKTVTDPKGDKLTYEYDAFNRLKLVRDKENNILSENSYHYRTQN